MPRRWVRIVRWLLIMAIVVVALLLLGAPFYVYDRFNAEQPVAELWFEPLGSDKFLAHVATGDLCSFQTYEVRGDQWQLDASFLKWKGVAALLGFESLYRLDRLSGRYADIRRQYEELPSAHDLRPKVLVDVFPARRVSGKGGLLVDTVFGSSVYLDIEPHRSYRVYKTEDALIAKALEREPDINNGGPLTVVVDKACGRQPGIVERLCRYVNRLAVDSLAGLTRYVGGT